MKKYWMTKEILSWFYSSHTRTYKHLERLPWGFLCSDTSYPLFTISWQGWLGESDKCLRYSLFYTQGCYSVWWYEHWTSWDIYPSGRIDNKQWILFYLISFVWKTELTETTFLDDSNNLLVVLSGLTLNPGITLDHSDTHLKMFDIYSFTFLLYISIYHTHTCTHEWYCTYWFSFSSLQLL